MPGGHDALDEAEGQITLVFSVSMFGFAGVDAHPHPDHTVAPGLVLQGMLGSIGRLKGLSRTVKSGAKSIADHLKDKAVVRFDLSPQELVVLLLGSLPAFGMLARQPGTALDVSEKESNCTCGPSGHAHFQDIWLIKLFLGLRKNESKDFGHYDRVDWYFNKHLPGESLCDVGR